jgi:YVTN family beta-propeller protein
MPKSSAVPAVAASAGLISAASPQPNGMIWTLSAAKGVRALNELNLSTHQQVTAVGANQTATSVTQSSTGVLALGLGSGKAGAVQLLASDGSVQHTIPVSAPVIDLQFGDNGTTLYALNGDARSASVAVINSASRKVTATIPVAVGVVSIVPSPDQSDLWTLQSSGTIDEISLANNRVVASFSANAPGIAMATSPDGDDLYVLKGNAQAANISVVKVATEVQTQVLPAAQHSVGLVVSLDGSQLYDLAGTSSYGNIQIISL